MLLDIGAEHADRVAGNAAGRVRAGPGSLGPPMVLGHAFGCARVAYNDALRLREDAHMAGRPFIPDGEVLRLVTTQAKRTPERAWLAEVSAVVLQQSVADLHRAYRNYFRELRDLKAE